MQSCRKHEQQNRVQALRLLEVLCAGYPCTITFVCTEHYLLLWHAAVDLVVMWIWHKQVETTRHVAFYAFYTVLCEHLCLEVIGRSMLKAGDYTVAVLANVDECIFIVLQVSELL
jgi:hypothetical protein